MHNINEDIKGANIITQMRLQLYYDMFKMLSAFENIIVF